MIHQAHSSACNLRRQNWKDTGRKYALQQDDNSQDTDSAKKSTKRWVDREEVVRVQMEY